MQNQINNEANNQVNFQANRPMSPQGNNPKNTKCYILGLVTGILATLALVFATVCAINFFKGSCTFENVGNCAGRTRVKHNGFRCA